MTLEIKYLLFLDYLQMQDLMLRMNRSIDALLLLKTLEARAL